VDGTELAVIGATVFVTAVLSGVLGMAGGIALLAVLLVYLPPLVAIPLHGVIQLVSNGSRVLVQRRHARLDWIAWYALPLIPAGLLGLRVAQALPERLVEGAIGAVVLLATWLPRQGRAGEPSVRRPRLRFLALGSFSGFLSVVLGAVGPIIDPFFLGLGLSRQALVGTKAACQTLGHTVKVGIFGVAGFAFAEHAPLLALGALCAVAGSFVGSRLLDRLSERSFLWLYRSVLTALAVRLIWNALAVA
jgi:uncharacterized membrane protein YfcA